MSTLADLPLFGSDYVPARDYERLSAGRRLVFEAMEDGRYYTGESCAEKVYRTTGKRLRPESVRRYMRYLGTMEGWRVEKKHVEGGLFQYRLVRT